MQIRFLKSAASDVTWMRRYYRSIFPEGSKNAQKNYEVAKLALKANPFLGHPTENIDGVREYHIPRTPFCFVYRVTEDAIEVLRVLDERSEDSNSI